MAGRLAKWKVWSMTAALLALGGLAWWWWGRPHPQPPSNRPPADASVAPSKEAVRAATQAPGVGQSLLSASRRLREAKDPGAARLCFDQLRQTLAAAGPKAASAAIAHFLDSGANAPSHTDFKVGPGGFLETPSSLRVFLLDEWARHDPAAAAAYAKGLLGRMEDADEWAICLRNIALADDGGQDHDYLREKLVHMLQHEPWQQQPSVGFLQAFDVAVHLGGAQLLPTLSRLVTKQDNPAVAHAAYLALDRLTIQDPVPVLEALAADREQMKGREATRANYFARADVRDPAQRRALEAYLLSPELGAPEASTFAGVYPNANYMISHNLLTRAQTPDHATLAARDAEALRVVRAWLADERFVRWKPQLDRVRQRLELFVRQAGQNP
jgi:hypothetical protein